jgi:alanine racemase
VSFPRATIDGAALNNNLAVVRRLAPNCRVMAAVKANAYGHGLVLVARALVDIDALGVARIEEGIALRAAGITKPVLLLEGVFSAEQLTLAARHQFEIVVHSFEQIAMLGQYAGAHRFAVWLKLDTGMNRLGFKLADFGAAHTAITGCRSVGQLRLMTHFASAERPDDATTTLQLDRFRTFADSLGLECSIANSAGLVAWPDARAAWVRPGLMLYGISPFAHISAASLGLRPVMTLSTQLIAVRESTEGEGVGYNATWHSQRRSRIGVAAIGYGDGYPRGVRNGTPVLVNGREAPIAGRVSMDMATIDVTDLPDAKVGDEVILWGEGLPVERVASHADTIGYELICRVSARVAVVWRALPP